MLFGAFRLLKPRAHPHWVGMRIGRGELVVWSFLTSSARGAGLTLFPVVFSLSSSAPATDIPVVGLDPGTLAQDAAAVLLHTGAMPLAIAAVAMVVYGRLGVGVLRCAWLNLELLWAVGIITAGAVTLFTSPPGPTAEA